MYKTYRSLLNTKERLIYDALENGLKCNKERIRVCTTDTTNISQIFEYVRLDNPLIYYVKAFKCITAPKLFYTDVFPQYQCEICEIKRINECINAFVEKVKNVIVGENDYAKIVSIHNLICRNIVYSDNGNESHTIVGCIIHKQAVCEGIAALFKYLCDLQNIQCVIVTGKAKSSYESQVYEEHAWNKVKIEGNWYNVDVTFDLTIGTKYNIRHDYLLITDKETELSHKLSEPYRNKFLCSRTEHNYYRKNELLMSNRADFVEYLKKAYFQGNRVFEIKLCSVNNQASLQQNILDCITLAIGGSFNIGLKINYDLFIVGFILK